MIVQLLVAIDQRKEKTIPSKDLYSFPIYLRRYITSERGKNIDEK